MKYKIISMAMLCLMLLTINCSKAQISKLFKKDVEMFYQEIDVWNKANPTFIITDEMKTKLKELDKQQPYNFFAEATYEYETKNDKFDYAFLIYQVGLIRYKYFLAVNPEYAPGEGWVLAESMQGAYRERMTLHLKTNIDRYIGVLKFAIDYCNNNNYDYWTKPKDVEVHKKVINDFTLILNDYRNNKTKLIDDWKNERMQKIQHEKDMKDPSKRYAGKDTTIKKYCINKFRPLEIENVKSSNDIKNYFNYTRELQKSKFINAKTNADIINKIGKLKITEIQKVEIFKMFYQEDQPEVDSMTEPEFDRYNEINYKKSEAKACLLGTGKKRLVSLLGESEGKLFWDEIQNLISYNRENLEKL